MMIILGDGTIYKQKPNRGQDHLNCEPGGGRMVKKDLKNIIHKLGLQTNRYWMGGMVQKVLKT